LQFLINHILKPDWHSLNKKTTNTMEVVLDIKDKSRAPFLMELLRSLDYINVKEVKRENKSRIVSDLKESLEEVKLYEEGKIKLQTFDELLNEL